MDFLKILVFVVAGCLLVIGRVSAYYNQTYGSYTFILSSVSADNSQGKSALTNAQDWCRSKGYTLATIPNKDVLNYTKQFISSAVSRSQIANNNLIILNGKLYTILPGTWIWVNGQPINGVNIQDQQDPNQRYFYGFLKTSDYKIYASTHNNGRHFICEKPDSANNCVGGLSLNGRCYQRRANSVTWYSARNDCLEGGGDLASYETLTDGTFRSTIDSTLLANASATEYWVGMQRAEWRWEDTGLAINYTNWESGSPSNNDQDFLSLRMTGSTNWLWYSYDCSSSCRFICIANQASVMTTTPTSSTVTEDTPSASTDSALPKPSSSTSSTQPASNASTPNTNVLPLALGLGIGLGMGAILLVAIILGVLFIRRRQKSKSNPFSEPTSSSDASVRNDFKESDIETGYKEMKTNGTNNYNASTGNVNPGAIYAAVQPRGTLLPPTKDAETHGKQIVYADFNLIQ